MMHLAAFYANVDPAGKLTQLDAIADQALTVNNNSILIPKDIANLLGEAALSAATTPDYAELQSPSLRQLAYQDIGPIASSLLFTDTQQMNWHGDNPRSLQTAELLSAYLEATGGAAAHNYILVWLGDGPTKVASGKIFRVRASLAITAVAGEWVNGALTFDNVLPAGTYSIVGFRVTGGGGIAARLVFVGGGYRPGVPVMSTDQLNYMPQFLNGGVGVFGSFDSNYPPTVDYLGESGAGESVFLDLIKTA